MTTRRQFTQWAASAAALSAFPLAGFAQALEQVRIINGFPAGGTADATSRRIGEKMGGTAFSKNAAVVENKPGAGGRIACEVVKNAAPDGSTLLLTPFSCTAIYPHIYSKLSYDPFKDLAPVSIAAVMTHALAVGPMVPASVKTVKDYLAWAKANPNLASYGSPAAGSTPHFLAALLGLNNKVDLKHVPYRGSLPAVADMIGGQLASTSTPTGDALANHRAGKIRIIATSGAKRTPFTPDVATYAEQGFPELTTEEWFGFYAPARTPANVIANANAAINAALKEKSVVDSLALMGLVAQGSTPAEMDKSQREENVRWGPLVKQIGFTADS
ncbi:Bug family tripartite tricarboxylate transporter substrate binding protein [Ramlibacter rhizophilus]|uniref:Twin-arginine translocation pathway signal protein n=1 Tax=Ramlibacter rhizophilus TaxID=1781167 RepID=A0A4Z0BCL2_9BURK|nr:Bug family tripartite tricarboxylate transporter substrate binding protein [Ramlibacter rhizophilus]TFY96411.1 twin-arginine translocation pathway signal protein [Ramlibacter rhizophilus]